MSISLANLSWLSVSNDCGITDYPVSILAWHYVTSAGNKALVEFHNTSSDLDNALAFRNSTNTEACGNGLGNGTARTSTTTGTVSTSVWVPSIIVCDVDVTRICIVGETTTNTGTTGNYVTNSSPYLYVGRRNAGNYLIGLIAHVAIWKSVLSADDISSLLGGSNPLAIDASNLTRYWPFTTDDANLYVDTQVGTTLSGNGTYSFDSNNPTVDAPPGGADVTYKYVLSIS